MIFTSETAVLFLGAVAGVRATKGVSQHRPVPPGHVLALEDPCPAVPQALAESATQSEITIQPVLDYDTDSCYNVPAIDSNGNCCTGLTADDTTLTGCCRDASYLDNQNVYVRSRCNNGWCAYMFEHYFQKDVPVEYIDGLGHRHEWENIVVVTVDGVDEATVVAVSQHTGYETKNATDVRFQGTNPKVVYNKDSISTHDFRFANEQDDNPVENDKHVWIRGALIDWNMWPSTELRDEMIANWASTGIKCKLADDQFGSYLSKAIGNLAPGFDVNSDA